MNFLRQSYDDPAIFALKMEAPGLNDTKQLSQGLVAGNNTNRIALKEKQGNFNCIISGENKFFLYFLKLEGETSRMLD